MVNGILLLDKPKGLSSNTAVNIVKKCVGADKAGHLGTLDVEGHGLLPVTLGKSTRLFDYFLNKDKVYDASFRFGVETTTLDMEGEVTRTDNKIITKDDILSVIPSLLGKQDQMPPQYSAKKINGQKAYDLARRGEVADLKPKSIEIYDLNLLEQLGENEFSFRIHCSSGTYIRSLVRDMAGKLSTCGVMYDIIRTRCGVLCLKDSFSLEEVKNDKYKIIPPYELFDFEKVIINEEESEKVLNGVIIDLNKANGQYLIFNKSYFIGVGEVKDSKLKIELRLI